MSALTLLMTTLLSWGDLEPGQLVHLAQPLRLTPEVVLPVGSRFAVNRVEPLPGIKVQVVSLRNFPCPSDREELRIPMTLLESGQGIEWNKGCQMNLYFEFKEYYRPSLFEADPQ